MKDTVRVWFERENPTNIPQNYIFDFCDATNDDFL
jgi:hypothetical protein